MEIKSCLIKYEIFGEYKKINTPKKFSTLVSIISKDLYPSNFTITWLKELDLITIKNENDYNEIIRYIYVNKIQQFKLFVHLYKNPNKKNFLQIIKEEDDDECIVKYEKCVKCKS